MDRNGNGDLTEKGERVKVSKKTEEPKEFGKKVELLGFDAGAITAHGGKSKPAKAYFTFKRVENKPATLRSIWIDLGGFSQLVGSESLLLGDRPDKAPTFHFDGPLTIATTTTFLSRNDENELYVYLRTVGVGKVPPALVACESLPKDAHPVATIQFPNGKVGESPPSTKVILKGRC
jgi:hypothetical protein